MFDRFNRFIKRLGATPVKKPLLSQATWVGRYACIVCKSNTRMKVCGPCPKCGTHACTKAHYNAAGELIDTHNFSNMRVSQNNSLRRTTMENPRIIRQKLKDAETQVEELKKENKKLRAQLGKTKPKAPAKKVAKKVSKKKASKKVAKKVTKKSAAK